MGTELQERLCAVLSFIRDEQLILLNKKGMQIVKVSS